MLDISLSSCWIFILLFFIGIGPALFMTRQQQISSTLALAPCIGLIITTLIGTYLVLLNLPIKNWANYFLLFTIIPSCLLSLFAVIYFRRSYQINRQLLFLFGLGLLLTILMVMLPMLVGGLDFSVLRGNRIDTFNYIAMAGYLLNEPYEGLLASAQTMIDKQPIYYFAQVLYNDRAVYLGMLMGLAAAITHLPLYRLEYGFTTIFYILLFGPSFILGLQLKLKPSHAFIAALAICTGFWGQLVLDMRAMSHISVLPLLVLLVHTIIKLKEKENPIAAPILLGLTFAAICILYIEILPLLLLGSIIFLILASMYKQITVNDWRKLGIASIVFVIALLPVFSHLYKILLGQANSVLYGGHGNNNWDIYYFPWLFHKIFIGFWGLSIINSGFIAIFLFLLSVVLSLLLAYSLLSLFRKQEFSNFHILHTLTLATLLEFLYLYLTGKYWAAGKALSYGYPFILFTLVFLLNQEKRVLFKFAKLAIVSWLSIQCLLGFYRISSAANGKDYQNYIVWGEYRQHDLNFDKITRAIENNHCRALEIDLENRAIAEYAWIVYGWDLPVINSAGILGHDDKLVGHQTYSTKPDCVLTDKKHLAHTDNVLANNRDYVLIKTYS